MSTPDKVMKLKDGKILYDDLRLRVENLNTAASTKANKVSNATSGNFASLDGNGDLVDSGHKHSDYLTQHQDISGKANIADLAGVAFSGSYNDLQNKPSIPTKVSDLTDDSGHYTKPAGGIPASDLAETYLTSYTETDPTVPSWAKASSKPIYTASEVGAITETEANALIATAIGGITSFGVEVVQTLPTQGIKDHTIYFVPKTGSTNDVYDEYIRINNAWELIGSTQVDLSGYALKSELPTKVSDLTDDSGHYTKPSGGIPATDLAETYVTDTVATSTFVQKSDIATQSNLGIVKVPSSSGLSVSSGSLSIDAASSSDVKAGSSSVKVSTPSVTAETAFYGLAKAAGDSTQAASQNAVGSYTDGAKSAIRTMLGVPQTQAIPTKVSDLTNDSGFITSYTETDPTVPAWAKASSKPTYTAQEVGALPSTTAIPAKVSDLVDDSGHYTKPSGGIPASDLAETYLTSADLPQYASNSETQAIITEWE